MFTYFLYILFTISLILSLISVILSLILSLRIILLYISHIYILRCYTDKRYGLLLEPSPGSIPSSELSERTGAAP